MCLLYLNSLYQGILSGFVGSLLPAPFLLHQIHPWGALSEAQGAGPLPPGHTTLQPFRSSVLKTVMVEKAVCPSTGLSIVPS